MLVVEFGIFTALFGLVTVLGFAAGRWRRPNSIHNLEEWGLGGRAFGNWVTWFLLGGDIYTAYTFVAVPALVYGVGAFGFFAIPFAAITCPLVFVVLVRLWSVAHVHRFVTPSEFVRARFGSRGLAAFVAVTGIVATMPYIALQLIGMEAVFKIMGVPSGWPLTVAFALLAGFTFNSGLRAPALLSIVKDILLLWTVLAALLAIAMTSGGWGGVFQNAEAAYARTAATGDGLLLPQMSQTSYATLVVGSALAIFLYPHAITGVLAARNRATIKRNLAALPVYSLMLGLVALLGLVAVAWEIKPLDGDRNTVVPLLFARMFPDWCAGLALAAIGIGALVPAAVMSIAAANLFTRSIYREYLRPDASPEQEARVSRTTSLLVKAGAVACILLLDPQFSIDLQLIGGVIILQTLPAVAVGLYSAWPHRWALAAGMAAGLAVGIGLLYEIPQRTSAGQVVRPHFGGSSWPLAELGFDTRHTVYVGLVALAANFAVTIVGTAVLRALRVPAGRDRTSPSDYVADEGDRTVHRMSELVDGGVLGSDVLGGARPVAHRAGSTR